MGNTRALSQKCCPLPLLLPIGIILAQFWHQFGSKVLLIGLTVAHYSHPLYIIGHSYAFQFVNLLTVFILFRKFTKKRSAQSSKNFQSSNFCDEIFGTIKLIHFLFKSYVLRKRDEKSIQRVDN
jgi:hypothetical protein